jgi:hypothetical protein
MNAHQRRVRRRSEGRRWEWLERMTEWHERRLEADALAVLAVFSSETKVIEDDETVLVYA